MRTQQAACYTFFPELNPSGEMSAVRSIEWSGRRILAREGMPLDYRKNIYVISSARNPIPWVANKVCEVHRNI